MHMKRELAGQIRERQCNISREIDFYTNPTHRWLGKMGGRSVENTNETGLTLRITLYSAEVQQTFMLTNILFMVVTQCSQGRSGLPCDFDADLW